MLSHLPHCVGQITRRRRSESNVRRRQPRVNLNHHVLRSIRLPRPCDPATAENVTLPPSLRIRNWIDFRDDDRFEDAFAELIRVLRGEQIPRGRGSLMPMVPERKLPYEPAPVILTSSLGPDKINERIISNLYPVLELPEFVYGMDTKLRTKAEIQKFEESKHIPGFILREGRLFTFSPLFGDSVRKKRSRRSRETLKDWFADQDHHR